MERIFKASIFSAENAVTDALYKAKYLDERISGLDQMINDLRADCMEVKSYYDAMYGAQWPAIIREGFNERTRKQCPLLERRRVLTNLRVELGGLREKVMDRVTFCERVKGAVVDDELKSCIDELQKAITELTSRSIWV